MARRLPAHAVEQERRSRRILLKKTALGYEVRTLHLGQPSRPLQSIKELQVRFAKDHCEMYSREYPRVTWEKWFEALSCGNIEGFLGNGVKLLYATQRRSGKVVGYISSINVNLICKGKKPHVKINHVVVRRKHRRLGVGRLLFDRLLQDIQLEHPDAVQDVRIIALEFNVVALRWYWRLGFVVTGLHVGGQKLNVDGEHHPVVYLNMQKVGSAGAAVPTKAFFGAELCGVSVVLAQDGAAPGAAWDVHHTVAQKSIGISGLLGHGGGKQPGHLSTCAVCSYHEESGLHLLDDGRAVNLTLMFAAGLCRFDIPLHQLLVPRAAVQECCLGHRSAEASLMESSRKHLEPVEAGHGRGEAPASATTRLRSCALGHGLQLEPTCSLSGDMRSLAQIALFAAFAAALLQGARCDDSAELDTEDHVLLQSSISKGKRAEEAAKPAPPRPETFAPPSLEETCHNAGLVSGLSGAGSCASNARRVQQRVDQQAVPAHGASRLQQGTVVKKVVLELTEDEDD